MFSQLTPSALNRKSPASPLIPGSTDAKMPGVVEKTDEITWDEETSSPFVSELAVNQAAAPKSSPLKMPIIDDMSPSVQLKLEAAPFTICEDETSMPPPSSTARLSQTSPIKKSTATLEYADVQDSNGQTTNDDQEDNIDDTCYSAFSEIPNTDMTRFSQLGQRSPTKQLVFDQLTPRPTVRATPATQRTALPGSPSATPTPRATGGGTTLDSDTTNLLLDFTQQFEALSTFSHRLSSMTRRVSTAAHPPPTLAHDSSTPPLRSHLAVQRTPRAAPPRTPVKNAAGQHQQQLLNLLDFDLPPAPTPRSVPSISVRELESVKAQFASQVSALKATLSGREAEVEALKRAVGDAERRVGEAAEQLREERSRREGAEKERGDWERRGKEFESVLRKVRADVMSAEEERSALGMRAEEAEERAREAEARCAEAEARATRAAEAAAQPVAAEGGEGGAMFTAEQVQRQIDDKVHALSTELHAIYKKKHVTKVAGLKKGFEAKTKEKTAQLQARVDELEKQCDELQVRLDGTLSGVLATTLVTSAPAAPPPAAAGVSAEQREAELKKLEEQAAAIERQKAELAGRDEELRTTRREYAAVMAELEKERVEKGELVAAVDEMLALQADVSVLNVAGVAASVVAHSGAADARVAAATAAAATTGAEDVLRRSAGANARPSGLARPKFGIPTPGRGGAATPSGLARPTGGVGKSRMMSNIERMGGARCE